jgi:hypothetical protein
MSATIWDQYHFGNEFMTMSVKQHRSAYDKQVRGELPDNLRSS